MQFTDLHIHSSFSDGVLTPKEIIDVSVSIGLNCISIIDHDTITSQNELLKVNCENKVTVISEILKYMA